MNPELQRACGICLHVEPNHREGCPVKQTMRMVPFGFTGTMIPQIQMAK